MECRLYHHVLMLMGWVSCLMASLATTSAASDAHPFHASCKVTWVFGTGCQTVASELISRMNSTHTCSADPGATCQFSGVSVATSEQMGITITAAHASMLTRHEEDVTIHLYATFIDKNQRCTGTGYSTTKRVYAHSERGNNFCTLYSLVKGNLHDTFGFQMQTDPSICSGYTSGKNKTDPGTYCEIQH